METNNNGEDKEDDEPESCDDIDLPYATSFKHAV